MRKDAMKNGSFKTIFTIAAIITVVSTGCGSSADSENAQKTQAKSVKVPAETSDEKTKTDDIKMEEQVIVEKDGLKIIAIGIRTDEKADRIYLDIAVQNDTDKIYSDYMRTTVNNYTVNTLPKNEKNETLEAYLPGETQGTIEIYGDALKYADIGKIGKIEFKDYHITEVEEKSEGYYESKKGQIDNPFFKANTITIQTEAVNKIKDIVIPEGEELYNKNGIRLVKTNPKEAEEPYGVFFFQNKSEDTISLYSKEIFINNIMLSGEDLGFLNGVNIQYLDPGKTAVLTFWTDEYFLDEAGIKKDEEFQSLEWVFYIKRILTEPNEFFENEELITKIPYTYTAE